MTNWRELISNISIVSQTYSLKYPNKAFFVPKLLFFVLNNFLHFGKSEDADFKYNNSFSNLRAKIPKSGIFVPSFVVAVMLVVVLLDFWYLVGG